MSDISRRKILALTGTSLAALAGCSGDGGGGTATEDGSGGGATTEGGGGGMTTEGGDSGMTTEGGDGGMTTSGGGGEVLFLTDYNNDQWKKRWEETLVPAFQSQTNTKITVEYTGLSGSGTERLNNLIQAGTPPEVFTGIRAMVGQPIADGMVLPVTDIWETYTSNVGDIPRALEKTYTAKGEPHMVPHGYYSEMPLIYRRDIYDKLGLSVPETWPQLVENARIIDESDEVDARGFSISGAEFNKGRVEFKNIVNASGTLQFGYPDSPEPGTEEIFMERERTIAALEFAKELAQYSPDPGSAGWGNILGWWTNGRVAQMTMLNAWAGGIAASAGNDKVARNTEVAPFPIREGADVYVRGAGLTGDGFAVFDADAASGAKAFFDWMYSDMERAATNFTPEPTRFMPASPAILETDVYQNQELMQKYDGHLLENNRKVVNEIVPELQSETQASTPATDFAYGKHIGSRGMNRLLVQGESPEAVYEWMKPKFESALQEGKNRIY